MMKIAFISPYDFPYPGGVTEHIIGLAGGLDRRGHQIHILAACSGYQGETFPGTEVITPNITPIPIGGAVARVGLSPRSYGRLKKILQRAAFDVIHLHEPLTPSITWFVLMQSQALARTALIGTFHAYHDRPNWFYLHGRPLFNRFFARLDRSIAVSSAARDFANSMFPADYQVIPNGVDLDRFSRSTEVSSIGCAFNRLTILFVGRLDNRKGFLNLLRAYIQLKPDYPQLQLTVVGPFDPKDSRYYREVSRRHLVTDVDFVGYVSPERLPEFYHSADIFCAPSIGYESFGIVLLEAMATGLPIVASNIAGYRTVVTDGVEGILVPPNDLDGLTAALRQLTDNPALRRKMGQSGRQKAAHYSWDHVVDQILQLYQDTIDRKSKKNQALSRTPSLGITSSQGRLTRRVSHVE
jgi:phosphatidylinositol alpha-mannosyltransferase